MRRFRSAVHVFTLLFLSARFAVPQEPQWEWTSVPRVVAVGDVHGAYDNLVLVLKNVTVDAPPGVSWEVHVEPVGGEGDPRDPHLVGLISAYLPEDKPAQFDLVLDEAIKSAGRRDLQLRFVPVSGVEVDGQPHPAEFRSSMSIGEILAIESAADD